MTACDDRPTDPRVLRSRAKMIDAATDLLIEAGPRAVTVDAVSERSGVAKSTLYRHWDSREGLLVDVMRANVPDIDPAPDGLGFEASIRHVVTELAAMFSSPRWRGILPALMMLQQHQPELAEIAHADHQGKRQILDAVLQLGVAEGRLPADIDEELVARQLIGPIFFAVLTAHPDDDAAVDRTVEFVLERFFASYPG
ncbi:MAG: TetR/AcrR family transcriptional regulator [Ilumatobacter sp.]|nr:TetR/AcrR family transcriptional regulator [Ilumatobacter sp.]